MDASVNWHISQTGIDKLWPKTRGKGVKVAIIDSGIVGFHPDIDYSKIILRRNFAYDGDDVNQINNTEDKIGHGTHCSGIIAARGIKAFGVAPEVSLLIGKIADSLDDIDPERLFKAIEWAYLNDADIISVSIAIDELDAGFISRIEVLDSGRKGILIGALSNVGDHGYSVDGFPFSLSPCTGVGASDKENHIDAVTARSDFLDILAPGKDIYSTWIDGGYRTETGCSMATPVVAGIIALMISYAASLSKSLRKDEILNMIKTRTKNFAAYSSLPGTPFPIIDPLNIFDNL